MLKVGMSYMRRICFAFSVKLTYLTLLSPTLQPLPTEFEKAVRCTTRRLSKNEVIFGNLLKEIDGVEYFEILKIYLFINKLDAIVFNVKIISF